MTSCDPLPREMGAHGVFCAHGRARREQLPRHLQVTVARSPVQRRASPLLGARAVSARPPPSPAPPAAPLQDPSMRARPPLASADRRPYLPTRKRRG